LNDFSALVVDDPIRVNLRIALGVQHHCLICSAIFFKLIEVLACYIYESGPEISGEDFGIVGAVVQIIRNVVSIIIILAQISHVVS
jgi:hypothetical protein